MLIGLVGYPKSSIIDLSGALPSKVDYPVPAILATWSALLGTWDNRQLFAAVSNTQWVIGNDSGLLYDGASQASSPHYLSYGAALSVAGGGNTAAIATASGSILIFDVTGPTLKETISFLAGQLALSADGSVLGALGNYIQSRDDKTLNFYSLPSTNLISSFPGPLDFSLSGSGTTIGRNTGSIYEVSDISGSPVIWSSADYGSYVRISPDGSLIGATKDPDHPNVNIYKNGTLVTAVSGFGEGWIDNKRFLVAYFGWESSMMPWELLGSKIYSSSGFEIATLPWSRFNPDTLPQIYKPLFPDADSVYDAQGNAIYSLTTGYKTWQGPKGGSGGAISGPYVVYVLGGRVMLYRY
jgi:hypothetical protein